MSIHDDQRCAACGRSWADVEIRRASDGAWYCERHRPSARIVSVVADTSDAALRGVSPAPRGVDTLTPPRGDRYAGRVLNMRALLAAPDEPLPWRCLDLACDGFLTVIAGKGGEGKSWLALALACGVARGKPAAGIECTNGRALMFDAENGAKLITRRFRNAGVGHDLAVQPVEAGGLTIKADTGWFKSTIGEQGADLVVFDSLRVLASGAKENDSDAMEPVVTALKQLARDTSAAVVLIHHRGRNDTSDFRGSSAIQDQTDLMFRLERVKGDPDGRTRRKLSTVKCRIEEEPPPRWLQIAADRERGLVTVDAAEPYDEPETERPRDALRGQVLGVLTGIKQSQARIARAVGRDSKDQTVRRVLHDLYDDGLASRDADGWGVSPSTLLEVDTLTPPPGNGSSKPNVGVSPPLTPPDTPGGADTPPRSAHDPFDD